METLERSTAAGQPCYRVRMVTAARDTVFNRFDVATGLLSRMQATQASRTGRMEATVTLLDYKDFGGRKMPMRTLARVMGQQMTTIRSVSLDPIPAAAFEAPAEIRALVAQRRRP
ncbi:MAG TPA: hypothetical protein VGB66_07375 [Longimicrobium sp.]|jgi:hypothetical protein